MSATLAIRRTMWVPGLSMTIWPLRGGLGAEEYQSMTCGDPFRGRPNDILPPTLIHSHTLAIPGRRFGSSARTVSIEIVAVHVLRRKVSLTTAKRRSKRWSRERTATPVQE